MVRSIVGRFLEHSRIYYFENGGGEGEQIYISSADWMPRNLYERVEVLCPIVDPGLKQRMKDEILAAYLADNTKSRFMDANGEYTRLPPCKDQKLFGAYSYVIARPAGHAAVEVPEPARLPP